MKTPHHLTSGSFRSLFLYFLPPSSWWWQATWCHLSVWVTWRKSLAADTDYSIFLSEANDMRHETSSATVQVTPPAYSQLAWWSSDIVRAPYKHLNTNFMRPIDSPVTPGLSDWPAEQTSANNSMQNSFTSFPRKSTLPSFCRVWLIIEGASQ